MKGIRPSYEQKRIEPAARRGRLALIASPDGRDGSVTVHIGKIDMGTIPGFGIPMIVAEELGIPVSDVTVVNVDTDASPWDAGTVGSRGILVSGGATRLAAIDARNQIFKMAARKLEASPDDLEIVDKQIRVKGTPAKAVALATVATDAHNVIGEVIGRGRLDFLRHEVRRVVEFALRLQARVHRLPRSRIVGVETAKTGPAAQAENDARHARDTVRPRETPSRPRPEGGCRAARSWRRRAWR